MTPIWSSPFKKVLLQTLLGLSVVAVSNASLAATAVVKVNISLPQVLTTSVSRDALPNPSALDNRGIRKHFRASRNHGHLVRSIKPEVTGNPVTFLYIQT